MKLLIHDLYLAAGLYRCPVVRLMPQGKNYGLVAKNGAVCGYKWDTVNRMLRDSKAFSAAEINRGK